MDSISVTSSKYLVAWQNIKLLSTPVLTVMLGLFVLLHNSTAASIVDKSPATSPAKPFFHKEKAPFTIYEQAVVDYNKALGMLQTGDTLAAQKILENILITAPNFIPARCELSKLYNAGGLYFEAEDVLERGLKIDKSNQLLISLAKLHFNKQAYSTALSLLTQATEVEQNRQEYYELLASCYLNEENYIMAEKYYNVLLAKNGKNNKWRLGLAIAQDYLGKHLKAKGNFQHIKSHGHVDKTVALYINNRLDKLNTYGKAKEN